MAYKSKNASVEAIKYDGSNIKALIEFGKGQIESRNDIASGIPLPTINGRYINTGQYVVRLGSGDVVAMSEAEFVKNFDKE